MLGPHLFAPVLAQGNADKEDGWGSRGRELWESVWTWGALNWRIMRRYAFEAVLSYPIGVGLETLLEQAIIF